MDKIIAMTLFARITEYGSFSKAADELGISRASATALVKQLENELGVRLLHRTTRKVSVTGEGQFYYQRCLSILQQLRDTEDTLAQVGATPKGELRVDLPHSFSRLEVIPKLSSFMDEYPEIDLNLSASDRLINPIAESIDCVVRIGDLPDSSLIARRLRPLPQITCASREYLQRTGVPHDISALEGHQMVGYRSASGSEPEILEFKVDEELREVMLPTSLLVDNGDSYVAAAEAGMGLIQIPFYHITKQIDENRLVEVLKPYRPDPIDITILYPHHLHVKPALRVFIDWMTVHFR